MDRGIQGRSKRVDQILRERARQLARVPQMPEELDTVDIAVAEVGRERFGIEATSIRQIEQLVSVLPVPRAPHAWAGIINLRGELCPLLDLGIYLGVNPSETDTRSKVVIIEGGDDALGLSVDDLCGISSVARSSIAPPLEARSGVSAVITGIAEGAVPLIDLEAMCADILTGNEPVEAKEDK